MQKRVEITAHPVDWDARHYYVNQAGLSSVVSELLSGLPERKVNNSYQSGPV